MEVRYSSTRPPAATIFSRAPALTLSPCTVTACVISPFASTLTGTLVRVDQPGFDERLARDLAASSLREIVETHDLRSPRGTDS